MASALDALTVGHDRAGADARATCWTGTSAGSEPTNIREEWIRGNRAGISSDPVTTPTPVAN